MPEMRTKEETAGDSAHSSAKRASVEKILRHVTEVSTLPHVALRVLEVARDPNSSAGDLRVIVEGDPSLSARVLRCVNSAAYGLRVEITSLQQAISYLGFNQIRNLAITASVSEVFRSEEAIATYRRTDLWRHMVSVGVCARLIASRQRLSNFEEAFLAGLLHDIGIVLEDQHCHEAFREILPGLVDGGSLTEAEQQHLGFDHTTLGNRIAESWRFPPAVCAGIRFHHMSQNYRGPHAPLVRCVEIANWICTLKGITSVGRQMVAVPMEALQAGRLGKEDIKVLAADLDHEISLNRQLFNL